MAFEKSLKEGFRQKNTNYNASFQIRAIEGQWKNICNGAAF